MNETPRSPKRTGRWLIAAAGVVLVIIGALAVRPLRIEYHRWQMERGRAYLHREDAGYGAGEFLWVHKFQGYYGRMTHLNHHLQQLVELGAIRQKVYQLEHVYTGGGPGKCEEGDHLYMEARRKTIHVRLPGAGGHQPMVLEVFNEWPDSDAWDEFVAKHDVPDYRERFMSEGEEVPESLP